MDTEQGPAYGIDLPEVPGWLNKGDNAWQMTAATLIGIQSMPGLVILYGSIVKKKWAVNSAFMAFYAFAATYIVWMLVGYRMAFGDRLLPCWGKASLSIDRGYLIGRANMPETGTLGRHKNEPFYPMASLVHFEFMYAAITLILLAGSILGRVNIKAWMAIVPLWLIFSYTVGAFSLWGGGFLFQWGVIDYSGGYVIHVSSGTAGFVAAYWIGPRLKCDRDRFSPNNILLMLAGAGLLWMGWSGFNGGATYAAGIISPIAIINTNISAASSLLVWTCLDVFFFGKPSVIGAVQGMITGLVCITPGAGLVQGWAAIIIGICGGCVPWFTMMILHKKSALLQKVDDTLAVFHTHTVAGVLGGVLTGLFAEPVLCDIILPIKGSKGLFYGGGVLQLVKQLVGALFVIIWNIMATTLILFFVKNFIPLRMADEHLMIGDDAAHGEEAYALWGDGEKYDATRQATMHPEETLQATAVTAARGVTIQL